ncbi:MAG TPA: CNNM domain-containing protein [Opitutaceae bacterium]|nr:CNNM domain-containing protein [Opitutaceae bacterium]
MLSLVLAVAATLGISFVCSIFEAVVLSTTVADLEALKKTRPRRGRTLETIKVEIDETISAILSLNTLANGVGSMIVGVLAGRMLTPREMAVAVGAFAVVLFAGAEILPKNIGVTYRRGLQPLIVYPLWWLRKVLRPVTWLCNLFIRLFVPPPAPPASSDEEIILLAERGAQEGTLTKSESNIIANALSLDNIRVGAIMTPRTVVTTLRRDATVGEVFQQYPSLPFGRMPVYGRNLDEIVGLARRRDLLKAKANDQDQARVEQLMHEVNFIPETATVANALQVFLRSHQQLLVAVDEFGATAGVVTMEDVIEHLLGREIFEKDDVAVDMREFARLQQRGKAKGN